MRYGGAVALGLLAALLGGCVSEQTDGPTLAQRLRPNQSLTGSDVVALEIGLIEGPLNDSYLNDGLWKRADEQVVGLERKVLLERNGLQVGQLCTAPPELLALLTAERSCANPRRILLHAGNSYPLVLGPTVPACQFTLQGDEEGEPVQHEQALCTLIVTPTLTNDGQTRLRFTPQVKYGQANLVFRPATSGTDWALNENRPTASYSDLSWEVNVAPNEFVVVGGRTNRADTLGHQFFVRPGEPGGVQRLLAVRTSRTLPGLNSAGYDGVADADDGQKHAMPLAWQTNAVPVRASAP